MTGGRRRRRSPEVAEQEIIDAAEALLRERPFRELTVDEVMRRTDLSRPSFYVYFRDRHHLVLKVVERLSAESAAGADIWYQAEGSGREVIREATAAVVDVFVRHGAVMQATWRSRPPTAARWSSSPSRPRATSSVRWRPATCSPATSGRPPGRCRS